MTYLYTQHSLRDCFSTIPELSNLQSIAHGESHNGNPVCKKGYNLDSLLKFDEFPYLYCKSTIRPNPSALNNLILDLKYVLAYHNMQN